jgi:hypothetical protein
LLVRRDRVADPAILEQHLALELVIIGVGREIVDQPVDFRERLVELGIAIARA